MQKKVSYYNIWTHPALCKTFENQCSAQAQPWLLNEDVLLAKVQKSFSTNYKTATLSLHMYSVYFEAET